MITDDMQCHSWVTRRNLNLPNYEMIPDVAFHSVVVPLPHSLSVPPLSLFLPVGFGVCSDATAFL